MIMATTADKAPWRSTYVQFQMLGGLRPLTIVAHQLVHCMAATLRMTRLTCTKTAASQALRLPSPRRHLTQQRLMVLTVTTGPRTDHLLPSGKLTHTQWERPHLSLTTARAGHPRTLIPCHLHHTLHQQWSQQQHKLPWPQPQPRPLWVPLLPLELTLLKITVCHHQQPCTPQPSGSSLPPRPAQTPPQCTSRRRTLAP